MTADDTRRSAPAAAPGGPPAVLAGNAGFLLGKVHELARDRFEQSLAPLGLKARHYGVLTAVAEQGPVAQNALGDRLNIDRSTMVAVIDDLEAAGRVTRRRNPRDRRAYWIQLTDEGRSLLEQANQVVGRVQDEVFAPLDRAQRHQLHTALAALLRHLTP